MPLLIELCETISSVLSPLSRISQPRHYIFSVLMTKREKSQNILWPMRSFGSNLKYESFKSVKYSRSYGFSKSGTFSGLPAKYKNRIGNRASSERLHRATTVKKQMPCLSNTDLARER